MKSIVYFLSVALNAASLSDAFPDGQAAIEDICQYEAFQPQCPKNEVILISSATYGRMRIGRCITQEEVNAFETEFGAVGSNPSKMGCSADVSDLVHRKCTGRMDCEVRFRDFSDANIHPCFPINMMYLEVSYDCISVVDEERSCVVVASKNPIHIIGSEITDRKCGTKSQPFVIEAPLGEKVSIKLLELFLSNSEETARQAKPCQNYGMIIDRSGRRNVSICGNRVHREKNVYMSNGNTVEIILDSPNPDSLESNSEFIIKLEAIGCSNLIPPKDAWLKRMDDTIVIGCYMARQTWQLQCREGNWIGVFGNCSNGIPDEPVQETAPKSNPVAKKSDDKQVLVIVVIVGATVTFCLAVVCIGAVCLRRFYSKSQKYQEYKTLNFPTVALGNQVENQQYPPRIADVTNLSGSVDNITKDGVPTYSVYVGESGFAGSN